MIRAHPLRENLDVYDDTDGKWIRCTRCGHRLCAFDQEWKKASRKRLFPPTKAGPLMGDLVGKFLLEQCTCPSCGALLDTDLVEETKG